VSGPDRGVSGAVLKHLQWMQLRGLAPITVYHRVRRRPEDWCCRRCRTDCPGRSRSLTCSSLSPPHRQGHRRDSAKSYASLSRRRSIARMTTTVGATLGDVFTS
jgi:hypothetical protein